MNKKDKHGFPVSVSDSDVNFDLALEKLIASASPEYKRPLLFYFSIDVFFLPRLLGSSYMS